MSQVKITRENIAAQLSEEFGIAYTTAYKKIDLILNLWASSLITSDLNISSLGSFKINQKNSRLGRNPKTKEEHVIKSRKVISFKKSIDPRNFNGGIFIGVNGIVIKSHGNADSHAFANAIEFGLKCLKSDLLNKIKSNVSS